MADNGSNILVGYKEIADYLGYSISQVKKIRKDDSSFSSLFIQRKPNCRVIIRTEDLISWLISKRNDKRVVAE